MLIRILTALDALRGILRQSSLHAIVAVTLFFVPLLFVPLAGAHFETLKLAVFVAGVSWALLWLALQRTWMVRLDMPVLLLLILFLLFVSVSVLLSSDYINSIIGFNTRLNGSFILFSAWVLLLFFLTAMTAKPMAPFFLKLLVLSSTIVGLFGILQAHGIGYYGGMHTFFQEVPDRVPSLLGNPNFSSFFIASVFPATLIFFTNTKTFGSRFYYGVSAFIAMWAVVIFSSRGALLAAVLGFALVVAYTIWQRQYGWVAGLLCGGLAAVMLFMGTFNLYRPTALTAAPQGTDSNITTRMVAWNSAETMIRHFPWFGVGPGNFQIYYQKFQDSTLATIDSYFDDAHNFPLHMAATFGLPAAGVLFAVIAFALARAFKQVLVAGDTSSAAAGIGLVVFLTASWFNPVTASLWLLLATLCGICLQRQGEIPNIRVPILMRGSVLALGVIGIIFAVIFSVGDTITTNAQTSYREGQFSKAYSQALLADSIYPGNQLTRLVKTSAITRLHMDPDLVRQGIESITSVHRTTSRTYLQASNLYWLLYTRTGEQQDLDSAFASLAKTLDLAPFHATSYTRLALYHLTLGNVSEAARLVKQSISYSPDQFPAWMILAKIYQQEGRKAEMIWALEGARKLNPAHSQLASLVARVKKSAPEDIEQIQLFIGSDEIF